MASPSSASIIHATRDQDLLDRAKALGATLGMTAGEVEAEWDQLVTKPVDDTGDNTIASVFEYAQSKYAEALAALPPKPGVNPAYVTDTHILHALTFKTAE